MTIEIFIVLAVIVAALILFSLDRIPTDVVSLGLLLVLILTGVLPVDQAFLGFGSDAVVMIVGLLILTAALARTGVVDVIGRAIVRRTGENTERIQLIVMIAVTLMSAFISNTAATAFFVPVVFGVANRTRVSASKLLMPLAFASILSSSVTIVSTSTNIVVNGLMVQNGLKPMGMFELAPVGIPITVVGILYMFFIGRRLIPERVKPGEPLKDLSAQVFLTEVMVLPGSPLVGKTLAESRLGHDLDLTVVRVMRGRDNYLTAEADLLLEANDLLLVEGSRDEILKVRTFVGVDLKADTDLTDPRLQNKELQLAEVILLNRSPLIGRNLRGLQFRERYGLQVLAVNRHGETIRHRIGEVVLQLGDILMVQGNRKNISGLQTNNTFRVISELNDPPQNLRRAPIAIAVFLVSLLLATFKITTLPVAVLIGVIAAFATRTITPEEAYRDLEWKAIILIGSMLGVGLALDSTGAAAYLANQITTTFGHSNPIWILAGFFVLTMLLTQPMSNQAAAVVVVPIALHAATQMGLNPRTFAMMIAVAASCSYLTPLEPSCLMVYGPGNYRFADFLKVGSLLTIIIFILSILLVPVFWPL